MEPQRLEQSRIRYKKMLLNLGRLIKPDGELKTLKFACSDYIPAKVREKITLAEDLFEALEERGKLSHDNLEFLKDLLGVALAGRTDVLDVIREYEQGFTAAPDTDSARSPGKLFCVKVCCFCSLESHTVILLLLTVMMFYVMIMF